MELRSYPRNNAFSLLELIVAIGILSAGIIVILQALSFSARITGLCADITRAVFLAEDKMQELEFREKINLISKEAQEREGTEERFKWHHTLKLEPDVSLYKLNLDIAWQRMGREQRINLNTYLK